MVAPSMRAQQDRSVRIADKLSSHKTELVKTFLTEHPNVQMHFTPTYSSWLNQVELWFSRIGPDVIARGVFTSVADLLLAPGWTRIEWYATDLKRSFAVPGLVTPKPHRENRALRCYGLIRGDHPRRLDAMTLPWQFCTWQGAILLWVY